MQAHRELDAVRFAPGLFVVQLDQPIPLLGAELVSRIQPRIELRDLSVIVHASGECLVTLQLFLPQQLAQGLNFLGLLLRASSHERQGSRCDTAFVKDRS